MWPLVLTLGACSHDEGMSAALEDLETMRWATILIARARELLMGS